MGAPWLPQNLAVRSKDTGRTRATFSPTIKKAAVRFTRLATLYASIRSTTAARRQLFSSAKGYCFALFRSPSSNLIRPIKSRARASRAWSELFGP